MDRPTRVRSPSVGVWADKMVVLSRSFPAEPAAVREARSVVRLSLEPTDGDLVELVVLLADEVVTNAVVHGEGPIDIAVDADEERVKVMVGDRSEVVGCPSSRRLLLGGEYRPPRRANRCGSRSTGPAEKALRLTAPLGAEQRNGRLGDGMPGPSGTGCSPVHQVMQIDGQPECCRPIVAGQQGNRFMVAVES
jgi:hypothetical protein